MGQDKAFVELGGKPLVEWVLDALEPLTRSFVLVVADPAPFARYAGRATIVRDAMLHQGPLPALAAGLRAAREPWVFATSCDAPFLAPALVQALGRATRGHDAAVPGTPEERWPLTAFYHQRCLAPMERALARGDGRVMAFFDEVDVRWVPRKDLEVADPGLDSLRNLNTPADLEAARASLAR